MKQLRVVKVETDGRQVLSGGLRVKRFDCGGGAFIEFLRWRLTINWHHFWQRLLLRHLTVESGWLSVLQKLWHHARLIRLEPRYGGFLADGKMTKFGYLML